MINYVRGSIKDIQGNELTVKVIPDFGLGVTVSPSMAAELTVSALVELVTYLDVQEANLTLYGFANVLDKNVFLLLKRVKGIGSKVALGIVDKLGSEGLLRCIGNENYEELVKAPCVGKKTAARMVTELKDHVTQMGVTVDVNQKQSKSKSPS